MFSCRTAFGGLLNILLWICVFAEAGSFSRGVASTSGVIYIPRT